MQLRIQVMFLAAFMIACAMCLASLASAASSTASSGQGSAARAPVEQ